MTKGESRFRGGTSGACEATLYEFTLRREGHEPVVLRVAATTFGEAVQHVEKAHGDARVAAVSAVGMVEMVSGSPLN